MLLVVTGCLWYDSMRARERVIFHCKRLCKEAEVQFLDQTIALVSLSPKLDKRHGIILHRVYEFEVSEDGATRLSGYIVYTTGQVIESHLETAEGHNIILQPRRDH